MVGAARVCSAFRVRRAVGAFRCGPRTARLASGSTWFRKTHVYAHRAVVPEGMFFEHASGVVLAGAVLVTMMTMLVSFQSLVQPRTVQDQERP
ncbi:hypothetical protein K1T71_000189 [Dendrolimus kikuchii]|uniref:Uncharacterized protein n=1 Tax=Dendrolimus kikuchii TaxID=765133 RepID=A0ACC1DK64_9NEOP|nr:hypothetical protein K1T71_000189 [Dendrolimus kikuchii]